jgi:hypothetical protein
MDVLETIRRWRLWWGRPKLEALPFEELQNRYGEDTQGVYREFSRRLHKLVFYAAQDYLGRHGDNRAQKDVEELVIRIFEDFGPEFGSGEPTMLLLRFANAIRRVLDEEAFRRIVEFYYRLLPTYHIVDEQERRFLAAAFQAALAGEKEKDLDEILAERFETTVEEAGSILASARHHLDHVIGNEFEAGELHDSTEGYLP